MTQQIPRPFEIALDIGHSSIGWAVFQNGEKFDLLGTGVVLFPADDCLAIKRRTYSAPPGFGIKAKLGFEARDKVLN